MVQQQCHPCSAWINTKLNSLTLHVNLLILRHFLSFQTSFHTPKTQQATQKRNRTVELDTTES